MTQLLMIFCINMKIHQMIRYAMVITRHIEQVRSLYI